MAHICGCPWLSVVGCQWLLAFRGLCRPEARGNLALWRRDSIGKMQGSEKPSLKVFISYSRKDTAFTDELVDGLELLSFAPSIDLHDIDVGEDWKRRISHLIQTTDTVVFVITPDSLASPICTWEVDETLRQGKRLIPIVAKLVDDEAIPEKMRALNYLRFDGQPFTRRLRMLADALNKDSEWVREHTRLNDIAFRWITRDRVDALLLRGGELADAQAWAKARPEKAPAILDEQRALLNASEEAEHLREGAERQRIADIASAQQETAKSQRRASRLLLATGLLLAVLIGSLVWQSLLVTRRETLVFTSLASTAIRDQQFDRAMRFALQAYPAKGELRFKPASAELEGLLAGGAQASHLRRGLVGHTDAVISGVFSPDGQTIVTASNDGTARLWDAASGELRYVLAGHAQPIWAVSFSMDGSKVLTASDDKTARLWRSIDGALVAVLSGHTEGVWAAAFSPDGKRVATGSADSTVRIWDAATGQSLFAMAGHSDSIWCLAFSPDSRVVATGSDDKTVRLWDAVTGVPRQVLTGHDALVVDVAFGPDGRTLASASTDRTARIWQLDGSREPIVLGAHTGWVRSARFNTSGTYIVTASSDETARIWDAKSGSPVEVLRGFTGGVWQAQFSRDGRRVAAVADDHSARVWELDERQGPTWRQLAVLKGHAGWVKTASFSADGKSLLTASSDHTARLWDLDRQRETVRFSGHNGVVWSGVFNRIGNRIITAAEDGSVRLWKPTTGDVVGSFEHRDAANVAVFNHDGSLALSAGADGVLVLFDADTGKTLSQVQAHHETIWAAAFSPDGRLAATASADGALKVWEINASGITATAKFVMTEHRKPVLTLAFSPDGSRLVSGGEDGVARLWSTTNGSAVGRLDGHIRPIKVVAFSGDGNRIASGAVDQAVRIWDVQTHREIVALKGHSAGVTVARFIDGDRRLITASADHTARLWDIASGREVFALRHAGEVNSIEASPDGRRLLTSSDDKIARIWDMASGTELLTIRGHTFGVNSASFSPDGSVVVTTAGVGDQTARVWNVEWLTKINGDALRDRVCTERIAGAQRFSEIELLNPILRDLTEPDPCARRGSLSSEWWAKLFRWGR